MDSWIFTNPREKSGAASRWRERYYRLIARFILIIRTVLIVRNGPGIFSRWKFFFSFGGGLNGMGSDILEADARQIANVARETFERCALLLFLLISIPKFHFDFLCMIIDLFSWMWSLFYVSRYTIRIHLHLNIGKFVHFG